VFDAARLPAGIYFVRLGADGKQQVLKMAVVK
jgi:hypothetical protein